MSKFRYAYQKIVDLKTSEKTQAEWLLSTAVGKLHTEEDSLNRLYQERLSWVSGCKLLLQMQSLSQSLS